MEICIVVLVVGNGNGVTFVVLIPFPLTATTELETNPVPVITTGTWLAGPAVVTDGEISVIVGLGLGAGVIMKSSDCEVPPPGCPVNTLTMAVPAV
jgi:hypothetical protein